MIQKSAPPRVVTIGDIHGCAHALEALLNEINPQPDDLIVCLGDLIDQGRESKEVIDLLIFLRARTHLVIIRGNHEEMLLGALENPKAKESWCLFGGISTINSYRFGGDIDAIPQEHLDFIRTSQDFLETETYIFVHANYEPDLPPEKWENHTLRWTLLEEPFPEPHFSGKKVVVGHTEQRSGEILDLGHVVCIDTACYSYGWLTALDVGSGEFWQASRWGVLRESPEEPKPIPLPKPVLVTV